MVDFSSDLNGAKQKQWIIFFFLSFLFLFIMFFISHPRGLGRKREKVFGTNLINWKKVGKQVLFSVQSSRTVDGFAGFFAAHGLTGLTAHARAGFVNLEECL